jgi:hypothetical protein
MQTHIRCSDSSFYRGEVFYRLYCDLNSNPYSVKITVSLRTYVCVSTKYCGCDDQANCLQLRSGLDPESNQSRTFWESKCCGHLLNSQETETWRRLRSHVPGPGPHHVDDLGTAGNILYSVDHGRSSSLLRASNVAFLRGNNHRCLL